MSGPPGESGEQEKKNFFRNEARPLVRSNISRYPV